MNQLQMTDKTDKRIPGERALVIGLGKTGFSSACFLYEHGYEVAVNDSRTAPPALAQLNECLPGIAVFLGGLNRDALRKSDFVIVSPGISIKQEPIAEEIQSGKLVIGDIELFARYISSPVIAITGSNGKSTVTTLVGEMARTAGKKVGVGGNIGLPALDLIDEEEPELYVLELSSFQLETTHNLKPAVATILNISEDHMDRYSSLSEYACAKARIFSGAKTIVLNRDDDVVMELAASLEKANCISFGMDEPDNGNFGIVSEEGEQWLAFGSEKLLPVSMVGIKGKHNISNVLAALCLGTVVGLPMPAMLEAIRGFHGLEHRTQLVAEKNNIAWINDSKATNVGAAVSALNGLAGRKILLIAGGQGKGQDFSSLAKSIVANTRMVILIGEDAEKIEAVIAGHVPIVNAGSMQEAVAIAAHEAESGDIVLLSPACASFDMFNGYEDRGNQFMAAVRKELAC